MLGNDRELEREVALKVLKVELSGGGAASRMEREARILAGLEHPGIVPIHDVGRLPDGRIYYTMKLVKGARLDAYTRDRSNLDDLLGVFELLLEDRPAPDADGGIRWLPDNALRPARDSTGPGDVG